MLKRGLVTAQDEDTFALRERSKEERNKPCTDISDERIRERQEKECRRWKVP